MTTHADRQLWAEPRPHLPSLDQRRQAIALVYQVGAHTAHIAAWRLEQEQGPLRGL